MKNQHGHWLTLSTVLLIFFWHSTGIAFQANDTSEDPFHGGFQDGEYATGIHLPQPLPTRLNKQENHLVGGSSVRAVILDPVLTTQLSENTNASTASAVTTNLATTASFNFSYYNAGATDPWGAACQTTPNEAKAAFAAAGNIWAEKIRSPILISIQVCWSYLGASNILGYSGTLDSFKNFTSAPRSNVWYQSALANALSGMDLNGSAPDMYITFNTNFSWYYGLDSNPPYNQMDLVTVALHEIGHGLNFAGSMQYSNGMGAWGYNTGYPNIYDTFTEDGAGNPLIGYTNPSSALGSALISGNLWFNGVNANAANEGSAVRIYAPSTWAPGSSYSHLDYNTFNNTINQLMVYAVSYGEAIHEPGPVTLGMLEDMGWRLNSTPAENPYLKIMPAINLLLLGD